MNEPPDLTLSLAALTAELRALREEVALLRQEQAGLRQALVAQANAADASAAAPAASRSARAERLNREVWQRLEAGLSSDDDTGLDLLIDRLHDLALEQGA